MQLPSPPSASQFPNVELALDPARLKRYMPAAENDKNRAFLFYLWNCAIAEAFYNPLHFVEIATRNALHAALVNRFGPSWYDGATFGAIYDRNKFSQELQTAVREETFQHGSLLTANHVASALTFGFWEHIATKKFDRTVWKKGVKAVFPGAPYNATRDDLQLLIESVRRWRNRISHHNAIFDKDPSRKFQDCLKLLQWASPDTAAWLVNIATVQQAINLRPAPLAPPAPTSPPPV